MLQTISLSNSRTASRTPSPTYFLTWKLVGPRPTFVTFENQHITAFFTASGQCWKRRQDLNFSLIFTLAQLPLSCLMSTNEQVCTIISIWMITLSQSSLCQQVICNAYKCGHLKLKPLNVVGWCFVQTSFKPTLAFTNLIYMLNLQDHLTD